MACEYDIRTKPIEACAARVAGNDERKVVDWQPGNGTRYALLFVRLHELAGVDECSDWQVTWITRRRTMFVSDSSYVSYSYVQEKMSWVKDIIGISDAICIAEAIGHVLGLEATSCEEFDPDLPAREVMES